MKRILHFTLMIVLIMSLCSCSEKEKRDGDWEDIIKLSAKTIEFSAFSDSVIITTGGSGWWITGVTVNNDYFSEFKDINFEADSYTIKRDCFVIERRDKHTLFIKAEENPLNIHRIISVGLQAGDYFDGVTITQKPRP
jgi:hypothetical protein